MVGKDPKLQTILSFVLYVGRSQLARLPTVVEITFVTFLGRLSEGSQRASACITSGFLPSCMSNCIPFAAGFGRLGHA